MTATQSHQTLLERDIQAGTVMRDGKVVGLWLGTSLSGKLGREPFVEAMFRSIDGMPVAMLLNGVVDPSDRLDRLARDRAKDLGWSFRGKLTSAHRMDFVEALHSALDASRADADTALPTAWDKTFRTRATAVIRSLRPTPTAEDVARALEQVLRRTKPTVERFLGTLDPIALKVLSIRAGRELGDNAWASLDRSFDPAAPLARVVREAPNLFEPLSMVWRLTPDALATGADLDAAVVPFLADLLQMPKWAVARVPEASRAYREWRGGGDASKAIDRLLLDGDDFTKQMDHLARLPPSWAPKPGEWDAFFEAHAVRAATANWSASHLWADLLAVRGRWTEWNTRIAKSAGRGHAHVADAVCDSGDMAYALANQILAPAHILAGDGQRPPLRALHATSFSLLFSGSSLPRILEVSARWHRAWPTIQSTLASHAGPSAAWRAGFPDHVEGALELRVLIDAKALSEDASRSGGLDHCGASYVGQCREGRSRLASVRRNDGSGGFERLSTVELTLDTDGLAVVEQHRGMRNAPAPSEARDFVAGYTNLIAAGVLRVDHEGLAPMPGSWAARDAGGYDFEAPGAFEAVAAAWDPILPRRLRGLDREGWLRAARMAWVTEGRPKWSAASVVPRSGATTPGVDGCAGPVT